MTMTADEIRAGLVSVAYQRTFNRELAQRCQELVAAAAALGDEELEYQARMTACEPVNFAHDTDAFLTNFAWCVGRHDADPERFPAEPPTSGSLLWFYKWAAAHMLANPAVGLDQIEASLTDMERTYRRAGAGMFAVLDARHLAASRTGRAAESAAHRAARDAAGRDRYADCDICVLWEDLPDLDHPDVDKIVLAERRRALETGRQCDTGAVDFEGRAQVSMLRVGDRDDAVSTHLRTLRRHKRAPERFDPIGWCLQFCAMTGNTARGLALLESHQRTLAGDHWNLQARMWNLHRLSALLAAVTQAGHGADVVRGSDNPELVAVYGDHDGPWSVADLAEACRARAADIACLFDERNGNDHITRQLALSAVVGAERYDLPIGEPVFVPRPPERELHREPSTDWVGDIQSIGALAGPQAGLDRMLAHPKHLTSATACRTIIAWLVDLGRPDEATEYLPARLAALRAEGKTEVADFEEARGLDNYRDPAAVDPDVALAHLARYRELNAVPDVLLTLTMGAASSALAHGDSATALALGSESEPLLAEGDPAWRWVLLRLRASATAFADPAAAVALLTEGLADPDMPIRHRLAAQQQAAIWAGQAGDADAATAHSTAVLELASGLDHRPSMAAAAGFAATVQSRLGRPAKAIPLLQLAVREVELAGGDPAQYQFDLGSAQYHSGQLELAAETFGTLVDTLPDTAPPGARGEVLYWLGQSLAGSAPNEAWVALSEGLDEAPIADHPELRMRLARARGRLFLRYGDQAAITDLDEALVCSEQCEVSPAHVAELTIARAAAAVSFAEPDVEDRLALALSRAEEAGEPLLIADAIGYRADWLIAREQYDDAVASLLAAADIAAAAAPDYAAHLETGAARVLIQAERREEAVLLYRAAIERMSPGSQQFVGVQLELADVLEQLDRKDEATEARRLAGC